jgi:hypothetical protein
MDTDELIKLLESNSGGHTYPVQEDMPWNRPEYTRKEDKRDIKPVIDWDPDEALNGVGGHGDYHSSPIGLLLI